MKNILMLTDFSTVADNAAAYAIRLTGELSANLILFHAFDAGKELSAAASVETTDSSYEHAIREYNRKFEVFIKKLKIGFNKAGYKPGISYLIKAGKVRDCIGNTVKDQRIDLIVMGAHQYNDFSDFLFGKNVNGVIDEAHCPVLLIPEQTIFKPIKSIFYATDLRYCDIKIIKLLVAFAGPLNASISLLHVCTEGLPELVDIEAVSIFSDTIASRVSYPPLTYSGIRGNDAELTINRIIAQHDMDILAIAHRKYHFFKRIFKGSSTRNMAAYTRIPILVMPIN
jgi:nucleotide-binding universal stress UspA family protein